jgi:hypothetical protein
MQYAIVFGTVVKVVFKMVVETVAETLVTLIYFSKQRLVSDSN